MSALRLVDRKIGSRIWYSLVREDTGLIAQGAMRSQAEAEAWAAEFGHEIVNVPKMSEGPGPCLAPAPSGQLSAGVERELAPAPPADPLWSTNGTGKWHSLPRPADQSSAPVTAGRVADPGEMEAHAAAATISPGLPIKETAPCCLAKRLPDGRPVIGFCGPECVRRPARRSA